MVLTCVSFQPIALSNLVLQGLKEDFSNMQNQWNSQLEIYYDQER